MKVFDTPDYQSLYDDYCSNGEITLDYSSNHNGIITNKGSILYRQGLDPADWLEQLDLDTFSTEDWSLFNDSICKLANDNDEDEDDDDEYDEDEEDDDDDEDDYFEVVSHLKCWEYICIAIVIKYEVNIPEKALEQDEDEDDKKYCVNSDYYDDIIHNGSFEVEKCVVTNSSVWEPEDIPNAVSISMENEVVRSICKFLCDGMKQNSLADWVLTDEIFSTGFYAIEKDE